MAKYREGDKLVEAFQYFAGEPDPDWLIGLIMEGKVTIHQLSNSPVLFLMVITEEGTFRVDDGGWLVRYDDGSVVPCDPEIFETVYEEVK